MTFRLIEADCIQAMAEMEEASVDAIVTDPPYLIGFMGKAFDSQHKTFVERKSNRRAGSFESEHGNHNPTDAIDAARTRRSENQKAQQWHQAWATEALRVLKPGGHLLAFGGTRTIHRLICALEDAGFEIRDMLAWLFGSGFPKSLNLDGEWKGWGTALKPGWEGITLARKPLIGSVAQNVLTYGTGGLNIDGTRIETDWETDPTRRGWQGGNTGPGTFYQERTVDGPKVSPNPSGRWPPNVLLDEEAAAMLDEQSGERPGMKPSMLRRGATTGTSIGGNGTYSEAAPQEVTTGYDDQGGASRFFKVVTGDERATPSCDRGERVDSDVAPIGAAVRSESSVSKPLDGSRFRYLPKADREERNRGLGDRNGHPTVKPVELMQWLVRLITPPKGLVLDPFAGSGSTLIAACREGFDCIGIEREAEYVAIARDRIIGDGPLFNVEAI